MSTQVLDLHNAVNSRFKTLVETPEAVSVAYENFPHTPTSGASWIRLRTLPGDAQIVSTRGGTNRVRTTGLVVASVFTPLNLGAGAALSFADKIRTAFTNVIADGIRYLESFTTNIGRVEPGEWQVNVTIRFYVDEFI